MRTPKSKPKTNFENGIGMYIPKRHNKEYELKTCDFFLALLDHPEDIIYTEIKQLYRKYGKSKLKLTTLIDYRLFNETCINNNLLPIYTHTYLYIYIYDTL